MQFNRSIPMSLGFALLLTCAARPALADGNASPSPNRSNQNIIYEFTDDLLAGGGLDVYGAQLVISKHLVRCTLIRPRTAFVLEMLKSVEDI